MVFQAHSAKGRAANHIFNKVCLPNFELWREENPVSGGPDYSKYSLEQLREALFTIDERRFPGRAMSIQEWIERRENEPDAGSKLEKDSDSEKVEPVKGISKRKLASIVVGVLVLFSIVISSALTYLKSSDIYKEAIRRVETDKRVTAVYGEPLEFAFIVEGSIYGKTSPEDHTEVAEMSFRFSGPKASGKVYFKAYNERGRWRFQRLVVISDETSDTIDLH